jgi:AmiR/NasT family two-component response regulator
MRLRSRLRERRGLGRALSGGQMGRISHRSDRMPRATLPIEGLQPMAAAEKDPAVNALKIMLADEDEGALRITASLLRDLGHEVTQMAIGVQETAEVIARDDPDLSIVVVYESDNHALDLIEEMTEYARGPVIAIVEKEAPEFVGAAAERGIDAFAREGMADSIQSAIEVAVRRHSERCRLVEQVQRLESALERRAMIERAKGILMERHSIGERAAFDLLRDHARSRNRTVVDVAASVTEGHALLPKARD